MKSIFVNPREREKRRIFHNPSLRVPPTYVTRLPLVMVPVVIQQPKRISIFSKYPLNVITSMNLEEANDLMRNITINQNKYKPLDLIRVYQTFLKSVEWDNDFHTRWLPSVMVFVKIPFRDIKLDHPFIFREVEAWNLIIALVLHNKKRRFIVGLFDKHGLKLNGKYLTRMAMYTYQKNFLRHGVGFRAHIRAVEVISRYLIYRGCSRNMCIEIFKKMDKYSKINHKEAVIWEASLIARDAAKKAIKHF